MFVFCSFFVVSARLLLLLLVCCSLFGLPLPATRRRHASSKSQSISNFQVHESAWAHLSHGSCCFATHDSRLQQNSSKINCTEQSIAPLVRALGARTVVCQNRSSRLIAPSARGNEFNRACRKNISEFNGRAKTTSDLRTIR